MYRNIFYNARKGSLTLWSWNDQGDRTTVEYPFKPYIYIESQSVKDATSVYNTPLQKREFRNQFDRSKYIKSAGIKRIFYNIPAQQQFLIEQYAGLNKDPDFSKNPLKIFFLDIETYSPGAFPDPSLAQDAINVITIYDSLVGKYITWGTGGKGGGDYKSGENTIYKSCDSEAELLQAFLKYWAHDYPDIVTGWNTEGFDIPYIINRIKNVLGEDFAKKLSPVHSLYCRENVIKRFGKTESKWYIHGISHIDYMEAYKTFTREQREKYSLDYIGEVELGENKAEVLASSLWEFADKDWQGFVDYNIQDVKLLVNLEEKLRYLQLVRMLAYKGMTGFEAALGTIQIVTGAMAIQALNKGMIIPTFETGESENYEGGYVKDPIRGMKEGIVSFDANSLYPNTIISLNISPETKIGKIIGKADDKITIRLVSGKIYNLTNDEFVKFVKEENLSISKAKVLYTQKIKGFCPELVEGIYTDRVENKRQLKEHRVSIKHCKKDSEKYIEHNEMINHLDIMQYTLKILMNRLYGTFANKWSPFYDIDAASSITLTGQACVKQANIIINTLVKEKYGVDEDVGIYSDTDSIYLTIQPVLNKLNKQLLTASGKISREAYHLCEEFEDYLNKEINIWAAKTCNIQDSRFVFKRETICDTGVFIQKKRYILHVLDDEGVEENKMKYVGVEVVSTGIPKKVKPLIKDIIKKVFETRDYNEANKKYRDAYDEYTKLRVEDIATPRGINDYDKYADPANGFDTIKRTPIHVKSAIYYNTLLDKLGLDKKYEKIKSGDKIKYFYATKNKYDIKAMGFINSYPKEFDVMVDRDIMFDKSVTAAVTRLYDVIGWRVKSPTSQEACDLLQLLS